MNADSQFFFVLTGPTAVGKTAISSEFFTEQLVEVINGDVGQFYQPLSIGTAKPDWRAMPVKHHLFDILENPIDYSVADYRERVRLCMEEIWSRGHTPLVIGGSLFYLKMLFFAPPSIPHSGTSDNIYNKEKVEPDFDRQAAWNLLKTLDPERARQLESSNDTYRLKRALEILSEGALPSSYKLEYKPLAPFKILFLTREREELYSRINHRVSEMLTEGWLEEVRGLSDNWRMFLEKKKLIGYNELSLYLKQHDLISRKEEKDLILDFDQLVGKIQQRTRHYAKRQITFWRMLKKELQRELLCTVGPDSTQEAILEVDLTLSALPLYIKQTISDACRAQQDLIQDLVPK